MSGSGKIRAFVALAPPPVWKESLAILQDQLKEKFPSKSFRWVKPGQIHVTLRFFGSITPEQVDQVKAALDALDCPSFKLSPAGLGCFPNARNPRVLWAGVEGEADAAARLQQAVSSATAAIGEPPDDRPFHPHLTLARIQSLERAVAADLQAFINSLKRWSNEPWDAREVHLMQSHLSPHGARYEALLTKNLPSQ